MKVISWNVNSVRIRHERLMALLARHAPDVLCLQELKTEQAAFPTAELRARGYHSAVLGQKTYNGVAIVSRSEPADVELGMNDGVDDPQARLVSATVNGVRVMCAYVPNGGEVGSEKFAYKLAWLDRLQHKLEHEADPSAPLVLTGDFNVAPDERDVNRVDEWSGSTLCASEVRERFQRLIDWGLVDTFRMHHVEGGHYSWWDYRMLGFPKNNGLRIDHILATTPLAATCTTASIDRDERKGKQPSDHAPVIAVFNG